MKVDIAYFVSDPTDQEKRKIQLVKGTYSLMLKGWFLTQEQKDKIDNDDIPEPTLPSGIYIDDIMSDWKVYGQTFEKKDILKQYGAKWVTSSKSWLIPKEKIDRDGLIAALS